MTKDREEKSRSTTTKMGDHRRRILKRSLWAILLVIIALSLWSWQTKRPSAPAVTLTTLKGHSLKLENLKGKVVLVNFWATYCPSCIEEMPQLKALYERYHQANFTVLAIAVQGDTLAYIRNFVAQNHLPFTIAFDARGNIARAFGDILLTPTSFLIDKQGRIAQRYIGKLNVEKIAHFIETENR